MCGVRTVTEFQAKTGHIISQLYGRIGTQDLSDFDWDDKKSRAFINELLNELNLKPVPENNFIEYITENVNSEHTNIDELIEAYEASIIEKKFRPIKNELIQNLKTKLERLFDDKEKIKELMHLDKKKLGPELKKLLKS